MSEENAVPESTTEPDESKPELKFSQEHYDRLMKGQEPWQGFRKDWEGGGDPWEAFERTLPAQAAAIREAVAAWNANPPAEALLEGADLIRAHLERADLSLAHLEGADFFEACLEGADLYGARLEGAFLMGTHLERASLSRAHLEGASLNGAHLSEASLSGAHLAEADFSGAQLDGASLYGAHLGKANLTGANLERIRLVEADLKWADFSGASFRFARLDGSNFESANLANADLTAVAGFTAGQLAGADVTGTKLPGGMKDFESLSVTDEAAKNSRSLFLIVLLACVYSWLTLSTTTDAEVIMNTGSSPLPIIRVPVPILGFFLAAPTFLLAAYVYFHLYLHGLWSRLAELPAVFPDGRPLDQRAYPWLLTSLVRPHFERLKDERVLFSREKVWLSILLAWWVVPVTIYLFWAQALAAHVWYMNGSSPCPLRRFNGCRRRHVPGRSGDPGSQRPEAADGTSYARNDCCWGW